jgi:predicted 3-demethylubiquinone-9 3-methyltransferase (glyoxalase superfamily)
VAFYTRIFKHSRVLETLRYTDIGQEHHGYAAGEVLTIDFEINGQRFTALNASPEFTFNESVSFQIFCDTQEEIDHYWDQLIADGGSTSVCGWIKDRFGVSWQIVPAKLRHYLADHAAPAGRRVMAAIFTMQKLDLPTLTAAYDGR